MNINVSKRRSFRLSSFVSLVAMYSCVYSLCIVCIVFSCPCNMVYIIGVFYKLRDKERSKESAYFAFSSFFTIVAISDSNYDSLLILCICPKTSSFQYSCRFSLMQFITSEKSIYSFQRIFFKNAFHQALRVSSWANVFVNRARLSLYDVFLFLKVLTMASSRSYNHLMKIMNAMREKLRRI